MRRSNSGLCLLAAAALFSALPAMARTITVRPQAGTSGSGPNDHTRLQEALIAARPGDTIRLAAGRFRLQKGLSLDVANVTLLGAGPDKTILDYTGQTGAAEGLLITASGALIGSLAVENAAGNGLKSKDVDGISFVNLRVEWTGGPKASNGAYGVYPVSSKNVLIERTLVKGASDAGIYVGQSQNIIVRNNTASMNVAGIEIENSYNADVHDNLATNNAGGLLVFDLPDLPQQGGHSVRLFNNRIIANNHVNFAAPGNIVANVPSGTGIMVMANRNIHITGNEITDNKGNAVMLVAYTQAFTDKAYNPLPRGIAVRSNRFSGNGNAPSFKGGAEIAAAIGGTIPPVMWDGVQRFTSPGAASHTEADGPIIVDDSPVLNLGLGTWGTPLDQAKPSVGSMTADATQPNALHEPDAIQLPAAQLARAAAIKGGMIGR